MGIEKTLIFGSCACESWGFLEPLRAENRLVICADGGLRCAREAGFQPQMYIGDGDSGGAPVTGLPAVTLPCEKDWTDLEAAWRWAGEQGCSDFVMTACTGRRQDHNLAACGLLELAAAQGQRARILDPWNEITCLLPGSYTLHPAGYRYFSLLPLDRMLEDVTITGAKFPAAHAQIRRGTSLAVSNEPLDGPVQVSIGNGTCLLIYSR